MKKFTTTTGTNVMMDYIITSYYHYLKVSDRAFPNNPYWQLFFAKDWLESQLEGDDTDIERQIERYKKHNVVILEAGKSYCKMLLELQSQFDVPLI